MDWTRQERIEMHDRLVAMLDDVRKEIMAKYPAVESVDVGLKEIKGQPVQEFCFRIYVKEKKPLSQLKPEERIPAEIRGVPTDVIVYHTIVPAGEDTNSYDPIWGGIQIGAQGTGAIGTLGCLVTLNADGKVHLLTNHHVLVDGVNGGADAIGKLVGQPDEPSVCQCCCCSYLATIVQVRRENFLFNATSCGIECGIARLNGQNAGDPDTIRFAHNILQIGPLFGSPPANPAIPGDRVRKRGRTTGLTAGTITTVTANGEDSRDHFIFRNQIQVNTNNGTAFAAGGDSGSVIVNNLNQVVGLLWGIPDVPNTPVGTCCRIDPVLNALGITIPSVGTAGAIPLASIDAEPIPVVPPLTFIHTLEQKLKGSQPGQELLQAIRDNRQEVMDLINDNREVKVAWNRYHGPAYIGHLMKNAREPAHSVPREIQGYSFNNLLIKMSDVLERNGSRKLAKAVEDYFVVAFDFAHEYTGIGSLNGLLEKHNICPHCGTMKKTKRHA